MIMRSDRQGKRNSFSDNNLSVTKKTDRIIDVYRSHINYLSVFLNHPNLHSADFLSIKPSIVTLIVKFTIHPIVTFLITYIVAYDFSTTATMKLIPAPFMRILNLHGIPFWMLCLSPSSASVLGSDHKNSDENDGHDRRDPDNDENRMTAEPGMTGFIRCFRRCAGS